MEPKQEAQLLTTLSTIAASLDQIARAIAPKAPGYVKALDEFPGYDWETIGATVKQTDQYGAAVVEWGGYTWTRRSPDNKFGEVIYFSRPDGKKEDGSVSYQRLITFKVLSKVEPVSRKVESQLQEAEKNRKTTPAVHPAAETPKPVAQPASAPNVRAQTSAPAPVETAETGLKSNGHTRPFEPDYLREKIKTHADVTFAGKKASPDDRGKLAGTLQLCFAGLDDWRERVMAVCTLFTGAASDLEMTDAYVLAMNMWLQAKKNPAGAWIPEVLSVAEAGKAAKHLLKY